MRNSTTNLKAGVSRLLLFYLGNALFERIHQRLRGFCCLGVHLLCLLILGGEGKRLKIGLRTFERCHGGLHLLRYGQNITPSSGGIIIPTENWGIPQGEGRFRFGGLERGAIGPLWTRGFDERYETVDAIGNDTVNSTAEHCIHVVHFVDRPDAQVDAAIGECMNGPRPMKQVVGRKVMPQFRLLDANRPKPIERLVERMMFVAFCLSAGLNERWLQKSLHETKILRF